ncbi:hypothetical protein OOK58_37750 [Streptomyces sp. NBC_01728]|uniref:hypothetical protein n=1 Tax=unclassified Streptomyces TaxID=2593676 RepID=UPI002252E9DC|nr:MULTISPECIES: hypothetical protein [unclassified Streptomyces]MCX4457703.1 hypothetical protein [Streptomyces sp. NBC_01719]MCX4497060.1 hypothetical protein [Streptomyces sp. NBC_01728]
MALEPVEATLIAASVTSVVSTAAVVLTHLLARGRDRQHKVWDRKMDTYAEVVRLRQEMGRIRLEVLETKRPPTRSIDPDHDSRTFGLTQAQLKMFGSEKIKNLDLLSSMGFTQWMEALKAWNAMDKGPETQHKRDTQWQVVEALARACTDFDRVLINAIEDEADFKRSSWWKPRLKRLRRGVKAKLERTRPEPQQPQELS